MTEVTTTARRVAKRLNGLGASYSGGFCVFGADGSGGYFYTGNSYPPLAAGQFRMWVAESRVSARDIQALLDDRQEDR